MFLISQDSKIQQNLYFWPTLLLEFRTGSISDIESLPKGVLGFIYENFFPKRVQRICVVSCSITLDMHITLNDILEDD